MKLSFPTMVLSMIFNDPWHVMRFNKILMNVYIKECADVLKIYVMYDIIL